jgi:hypothetical protein
MVDLTPKSSTSNIEQTTTPKSNDSAERPIKDIEQLPTPSRTVSPDLPETNTTPGGLQDDILDTIEEIPTQLSLLKPSNRKTNTALQANEVSAEPSTNVVPPEGSKRIRRQAHAIALANLSTLFGYYTGFTIGLVKDIDRTRSLSSSLYRDNLPPKPKNLKELRKHLLTTGFQKAMEKEYNDLKRRGTFKVIPKEEASNKQILLLKWVFKYKLDSDGYLQKLKAQLCIYGDLQITEEETYAATLAAQIFRALMAIAAAFDLEIRQYNAVNVFINAKLSKLVYCYCLEGFN